MKGSVFDNLTIVDAWRLVSHAIGKSSTERPHNGQILVRCICTGHLDEHPSCDLDENKKAWCCRACGRSGGLADLAIAAGLAADRASAALWYEPRLGVPRRTGTHPTPQQAQPLTRATVAGLAAARKLDESFLRKCGLRDGECCVVIDIRNLAGKVVNHLRRINLETSHPTCWDKGKATAAFIPSMQPKRRSSNVAANLARSSSSRVTPTR